ncbi:Mu domain [Trinorchestia longiramus]|nr:Mu domain [Trinorchestia longiramus]
MTPYPSPGMGQQSRSLTPDIHVTSPEKESDSFCAIFGQTIEHDDENDFFEADEDQKKESSASQDKVSEPNNAEEIDLFGEPVQQNKPKTTQDIMSLFNKAESSKPSGFDLLSDDAVLEESDTAKKETEEPTSIFDADNSVPSNIFISQVDDSANEIITKGSSTGSPEQVSEKTDSEPTVIETAADEDSDVRRDSSAVDPQLVIEEFAETTVQNEAAIEGVSDGLDDISSKPIIESNDSSHSAGDDTQTETSEPVIPVTITPPEKQNDVIENDIIGEPTAEKRESPEFESKSPSPEEIFGVPKKPPKPLPPERKTSKLQSPESIFGAPQPTSIDPDRGVTETFSQVADNETTLALFGESEPLETAAPESIFGESDMSIAANIFGDMPTAPQTASAPTALTPPDVDASALGLFGEPSVSNVIPSGAETTGATLFGISAPAPNVGMSLFGIGNEAALDIFAESESNTMVNPFAPPSPTLTALPTLAPALNAVTKAANEEEFDAFSARFESAGPDDPKADPFAAAGGSASERGSSPWGDGEAASGFGAGGDGFGFSDNAQFDSFLNMTEPPPAPQSTPLRVKREGSDDSDEIPMSVVIKPVTADATADPASGSIFVPALAPPPAAPATAAFSDSSPRFNPFDRAPDELSFTIEDGMPELKRTDSQETPPTPLFEEDQSQPLEPYPRTTWDGPGWEMFLRQPNKKKITGQRLVAGSEGRILVTNRFWKKVFVKFAEGGALQLFNKDDDKDPFHELPLQACYSVSDIGAQQFDQFGKIFTVKVQYMFYKERPGVRPGQISKAERITNKLSKFAQYAIAGDYEGVKEFASDVRKLGMPVEHAPQISQLLKLGTQSYEDLKVFASIIEEYLFKLTVHRDRALTYKSEEVQLTAVDEIYLEQDLRGAVHRMIARVRIFFLGFLSGMPDVDLGINDLRKQGKEVVGRHDIIPVVTEEWIRLEAIEFHCCVEQEIFDSTRHIKFKPPDACYIELMRFRVRPPKNRELPLQIKTKIITEGPRVEIQSEILIPGFSGRKLGQVPCEDVAVRFPIPECWIYMFRVEKHFRYGSVKSAHRRAGKVKGIERIKGAVEGPEPALMEVTSGQAKYEHQHRAIVWRMSRLPKEGQGAYTLHNFTCRMNLTAYDEKPDKIDRYCYIEFTMPATTVSHCVMRSVSVTSEDPPEKYVRYLARHEYKVEMEFTTPSGPGDYVVAAKKDAEALAREEALKKQQIVEEPPQDSSSDESS